MTKLSASKVRQHLAKVISRANKGERFLITQYDGGVAAVVSVEDLELLQAIEDRHDSRAAKLAIEDAKINGTVPWDQIKSEMGL